MKRRLSRGNRARNYYVPSRPKKGRWVLVLAAVLAAVLLFSAWKLISYLSDYFSTRQGNAQLQALYYQADETQAPDSSQMPTPTAVPAASPQPTISKQVQAVHDQLLLPALRYPTNERAIIRSRFKNIRNQNKDIMGWITIPGIIDQAVVQRDNEYYLRRDYQGRHNVNGAIFLEETCNLKTRPYTMILYGHNMKTGEMFGFLRNYENANYYHTNPFITFDTVYEDGQYVILGVGTISTIRGNRKYVDLARLSSSTIAWRQEAMDQLMKQSVYMNHVDVQPQDQLLLLVTCVDDSTERRVLIARRIRDGESIDALRRQVANNWNK
ncbi:MAG: class B sortase [Clostridiales bacterium]|nr:class B sortase [Clostridiales bacterium]